MLHNGNDAVGTDGRVNLYPDSVLCSAPELLDFEVLHEPLEEQLYLPPILVEVGNLQSSQFHCVGQEHELATLLLKDAIVTVGIGLAQITSGHMFAKSEVIALLVMCLYGDNQVSHALTIAQLSEHQRKELLPTCEMLHIFVASIFANEIIEVIPIEKCYQLRENVLVLIHMLTILAAKIQKSSPLTQKTSVTNYISIISKNAWRFLVDSNER